MASRKELIAKASQQYVGKWRNWTEGVVSAWNCVLLYFTRQISRLCNL